MRFQRSIRLLLCTGLVGSAALTATVITWPGGVAAATSSSVTCATMSGTVTSETFSSCTGTGKSLTGSSGVLTVGTRTIKWASGQTSKVTASYKTGSDAGCPNVSKYTKDTLESWAGTVASGALKGSTFSGSACVYKAVAAPHSLITKNKGSVKI